jgi:hypothetical protein
MGFELQKKYHEVVVVVEMKIEIENSKGESKIKRVKETYLVDSVSVTEAEAKVVKAFEKSGFSQEFSVISVRGSKIMQVIEHEEEKDNTFE